MSGGPFRELFVELSREAFEIAKAIGEQAVKQAEEREKLRVPAHEPSRMERMLLALVAGPGAHYLENRYGWAKHDFHRNDFDRCIVVRARLACGHLARIEPISELALHLAPTGEMLNTFIDLLDRRMVDAKRCFCVERTLA